MPHSAYRLAARLAHRMPLPRGRLSASMRGRRDAVARWLAWAERHRGAGPLLWVHAASVGEALAAAPVVVRLRRAVPDLTVVHSYSSSSVAAWPETFAAAHRDYVPLDEPRPMGRVLDAVRPSLLVFARGDLWPELVQQATCRHVPVAVLGATVRPGSRRLLRPLRPLYARLHRTVSWLGAVSDDDAERWARLGVLPAAIRVTGDPRHDQVLERCPRLERVRDLAPWLHAEASLVAGSIEPTDDGVLLEAARSTLPRCPTARLAIVPHDPSEARGSALVAAARRHGLEVGRWTAEDRHTPTASCVVIQARGLLSDLYAFGAAAYVGGGFRRNLLHAVIEPAAYGVPVLFGPRWHELPDARALVAGKGGVALPGRRPAAVLARWWLRWWEDADLRWAMGVAARRTLTEGASQTTALALGTLLQR